MSEANPRNQAFQNKSPDGATARWTGGAQSIVRAAYPLDRNRPARYHSPMSQVAGEVTQIDGQGIWLLVGGAEFIWRTHGKGASCTEN